MGKPANQPFNLLYMHCCLRGAARNRWTRDSGTDELGTDRNQRILPQLPSFQFSQTIHCHKGNCSGRIVFLYLVSDSFPRSTVTDAFGRLNDVLAVAVIVARAGGPSGSAIPPFISECH